MGRRVAFIVGIAVLALAGCGESASPGGDANAHTSRTMYGKRYEPGAVTTADPDTTFWANEISEGFVEPSDNLVPASIVQRIGARRCEMPKPAPDAKIVSVTANGGYRIPMYLVARGASEQYRRNTAAFGGSGAADRIADASWAHVIDVFVTESEKPVYLILGAYDTKLWNLNLADGVTLSGVVLVGYNVQSVTNLPDGVPASFISYSALSKDQCMKTPARAVDDGWLAEREAQSAGSEADRLRRAGTQARRKYDQYQKWLKSKVGSPALVVSAAETSHVLIGPKPTRPTAYRSLKGTEVLYPSSATAIWGNRRLANRKIEDLVEAKW